MRYLCSGYHPGHDFIGSWNWTRGPGVFKVSQITVAQDGTKILANASKQRAVSHGHALEQMRLLESRKRWASGDLA